MTFNLMYASLDVKDLMLIKPSLAGIVIAISCTKFMTY